MMRRAISIVLAALLATLPIKQVLGQAQQQDSTSTQDTSLTGDQQDVRVIRVPDVTPTTAALWQPMIAEDPSNTRDILEDNGGGGISTGAWVIGIFAVVVILTLLVLECVKQINNQRGGVCG